MKSIFACKLYKASPRKEKIRCAIENPVNMELVTQLSEYLDDEYRTPDLSDTTDSMSIHEGQVSPGSPSSSGSSGDFGGMANIPLGGDSPSSEGSSSSDDIDLEDDEIQPDDVDSLEDVTDDLVEEEIVDDAIGDEDGAIESSESIDVKVTSGLSSEVVEQLKGTLNTRQDTRGVNRVLIKDTELWIYYEDSINLNNVMGPAIELLNASSYTYLEFNRLARSANAIVFQICIDDTNTSVKPLEVDLDDAQGNN